MLEPVIRAMLLRRVYFCQRTLKMALVALAIALLSGELAPCQTPVHSRIAGVIRSTSMMELRGSENPRAKAALDVGGVNSSTPITGMTMYFKPSAAQQAELETLLQQQQTPGSPLYHHWITPAEYAARFGLSAADLEKVETWLEQQGFSVDRVANSHNAITFSGTAGQVEAAFQTRIDHYMIHGVMHRANAGALSIPSALAGVVLSVRNISDFKPHPLHRAGHVNAAGPEYTFNSGSSHSHFLAPGDVAVIYNLNPLYNSGYTGSGQTIVVAGQSAIKASDITNFQKAAGLSTKAPQTTLVPNTGTSTVDDSNGDEDESELDIEWAGAIAQGATINFVYVGNNQNASVFDAIQYAIEKNIGQVISNSYGACEAAYPSSEVSALEGLFMQANAQGQTIVSAAGDLGATDCDNSATTDLATKGLAVDLPASSPYVTGMGGTEFLADASAPSTYWNSTNSAGQVSAIQFIPEKVWNDSSASLGIQGGGGGSSNLFGKPTWQKGTGVPSDGKRDIPDISLNASPNHDGYLYCASGSNADSTSCSNGFLDASGVPNVAGGTSFAAPIFAGVLAILSQRLQAKGLGNVNPEIYALAGSAAYSSAFHDTTNGNNRVPCKVGSTGCTSSPIGYSATPGYDLASGWGSIDAANFVDAYMQSTTASGTTTVLTASNSAPEVNAAITFTATVSSNSEGSTPAGTVQFAIDGANVGSPVALSGGVANYSYTPTTAGVLTITANYTPSSGSSSTASSGTLAITVSASTSAGGSLKISATNVTVAQGSSGISTVTITSMPNGFNGSVALSVSAPSQLADACFTYVNPTATTSGSVTIYTSKGACTTIGGSTVAVRATGGGVGGVLSGIALSSLLLLWIPGVRRRRWFLLGATCLLAMVSLGVSGCGSSGSSTPTSKVGASSAPGTYTLTVTGTDKALNLSAVTTFTLTVNSQ
ncbi:MAG: protease pro-enzyme activation domain-containing protein [Acidobacteriaceae bacterium]